MLDLRVLALAATGIAGLAWATTEPDADVNRTAASVDDARPLPPAARRFHCRVFTTPLDQAVDTRDRSTDLGRWVVDMEGRGWAVGSVDFEVGQKPTGFAEGYVQVCLTPVLEQP